MKSENLGEEGKNKLHATAEEYLERTRIQREFYNLLQERAKLGDVIKRRTFDVLSFDLSSKISIVTPTSWIYLLQVSREVRYFCCTQ